MLLDNTLFRPNARGGIQGQFTNQLACFADHYSVEDTGARHRHLGYLVLPSSSSANTQFSPPWRACVPVGAS
jgi:hypothetical protein